MLKKMIWAKVSSFNFTRKAFYKNAWCHTSIKARGLFIDVNQEKIVARSYDKFFNYNEREETSTDSLKNNLSFPVRAYEKENGFLGILSYHNGELFYASKSTTKSDFAGWFKEIVESTTNVEEIKKILKNGDLTMVFEVNDPHIIKYNERHVVLLDIIKNTESLKKIKYQQLVQIAKKINVNVKKLSVVLKDWNDFERWYNSINKIDMFIEGFVLEDHKGFMFKIKLPYYSFWKYMRNIRDRLRNDSPVDEDKLRNIGIDPFFIIG